MLARTLQVCFITLKDVDVTVCLYSKQLLAFIIGMITSLNLPWNKLVIAPYMENVEHRALSVKAYLFCSDLQSCTQ